jgi:hypothetical protein
VGQRESRALFAGSAVGAGSIKIEEAGRNHQHDRETHERPPAAMATSSGKCCSAFCHVKDSAGVN